MREVCVQLRVDVDISPPRAMLIFIIRVLMGVSVFFRLFSLDQTNFHRAQSWKGNSGAVFRTTPREFSLCETLHFHEEPSQMDCRPRA